MNYQNPYWLISIRNALPLFETRSERFAFLNIWRTYTQPSIRTCAYSLIPGRFECVISTPDERPVSLSVIRERIISIFETKFNGIWNTRDIEQLVQAITIKPLLTPKDCVYTVFDLHTVPQRHGASTDYRAYPFSSYKALASSRATTLARSLVWEWFGGRMRFAAFHQAYAGWAGKTGT